MKVFSLVILTLFTVNGEDPEGPRDGIFILREVQIWRPGGPLTGPHDVVLRDREVQAISRPGQSLPSIPGARELTGENWVLYPGLVHASFPADVPSPPPNPFHEEATDPREEPLPGMEYGQRNQFRGWLHVADTLDWNPDKADDWRKLGFTSAQILPGTGLIRGRTARIALNGHPLGQALLSYGDAEPMVWSLSPARGGGYPRTSMAALALLRQARLDAVRVKDRPDPDLDNPWPALFLADGSREIENILDLVKEFPGQGTTTLLGGREAWKHSDRIRAQGFPVLWKIDLPEKPKTDEELKRAASEDRPWWQSPARLLKEERTLDEERIAGFSQLRESGAQCALVPGDSVKDFKKGLARLRENGLSDEVLWKSLSLDVHEILGSATSWGRKGSAADLVVHRGPLDLEDFNPAWVFADGRGWEFPESEKDDDDADETEEDSGEGELPKGTWEITVESPDGDHTFQIVLDSENSKVELHDPEEAGDSMKVDGEYLPGRLKFTFSPPDMGFALEADLSFDEESCEGTFNSPFGPAPVEGRLLEETDPKSAEKTGKGKGKSDKDVRPELPAGHPEWPVEIRADRLPGESFSGNVLLKGATLHTLVEDPGPVLGRAMVPPFLGDLLIENGRITAVGGDIHPIRPVPTVDASGWHIMPGIIDAHSHLALSSVNEGSVSISAECRVGDMIQAENVGIFRAAAGGCAVAQSLHGSANPVGGQAAVWELDYSRKRIADLRVAGAKQGIKFALGENVKQSNWDNGGKRFPTSRMGVEAVYRRAFTAARDYAQRVARRGREAGFRRDVRLETLAAVLSNDIHIQCHSYRADEILMFLRVCKDFGIEKPTFQHVLEGYKVAPELAAQGAMASTFSDWWAYKFEVIDAIPWNVALMDNAGVVATINSDSDEMIRRLNTEAAKSIRYGEMDPEATLAFCSRNAAIQLRLEDRLGTLARGKEGTISVFDGHPASTYSRCLMTLARGRVLFARDPERDSIWEDYGDAARTFADSIRVEEDADEVPVKNPGPGPEAFEAWTRGGKGHSFLVRGATVHPISSAPFQGGILVRDGRIVWMGPDGEAPAGEADAVVDAEGRHLYPGFVNGCDRTGIYEVGSVRGSRDDRETGKDHPDLSIASAIHGDSWHHPVTRSNGVAYVLVRPSQGRIRGQAALIQLDGEVSPDFVVVPDLGLHIAFPRAKKPKEGKAPEEPKEVAELDDWFDRALEYEEIEQAFKAAGKAFLDHDPRLEALIPYAKGEKPVLLETDSTFSLMAARDWAARRNLQTIYLGAKDGWKIAGYLGADRARIITGPVHGLPGEENDPYDSPFRNASILSAAGCRVGLRTNDPEVTRNLPFQAATAAAEGWGKEAALRAITLGAAEVLGVDAFVGSLESGKVATFFLADGDPLDFPGHVRRMWIGGKEVDLRSKQTELRDRYGARIERSRAER